MGVKGHNVEGDYKEVFGQVPAASCTGQYHETL